MEPLQMAYQVAYERIVGDLEKKNQSPIFAIFMHVLVEL